MARRCLSLAVSIPCLLAAVAQPAAAQSTWAGTASGSWNVAGNWSPSGIPANSASTQLIFDATANATMTADIPATLNIFNLNQLTFTANAPAYAVSGDTLSFHPMAATLATITMNSPNAVTIGDPLTLITNNLTITGTGAGPLTLNGVVAGVALGLADTGTGPLVLPAANSYTGATTISSGGTIDISTIANGGVVSPLGASSNAVGNLNLGSATPSRGNLLLTGTNATYSTDRGVTVTGAYASGGGGAIGVQNAGTTLTWNGPITGSGALIKSGAGILTLTNTANNYTGGAVIEAGTLAAGANGAVFPVGSAVTVLSGATFDLGPYTNASAPVNALGSLTINEGTLRATGATNSDFFVQQISMTGGTIDFTNTPFTWIHLSSASGITINPSATPSTWVGGGTSRIQNDTSAPLAITANAGATLNAGIILSNGGTNPNFTFSGGGSVRLSNTGNTANLTASGINVFSNDLSTDVGAGAFGTLGTGSFTLTNRAFLNYDGMSAASSKPLTVANGSIAVINPGANLTLNGVISNSDPTAFVEALGPVYANLGGTGTLTLTANNTYGGPTYVSFEAVLAIPTIGNAGTASPLGASSNAPANLNLGQTTSVGGRGDLLLTGTGAAYSTDRGATINGFYGFGTGGGAIGVQNAATSLTWNGQITGPGELIKSGAGTLILTNTANNWQGGTVVEAGQLMISGANGVGVLPNGSGAAILAGATLNYAAFIDASQTASAQSTFFVEGGTLRLSGDAVRLFLNQLWCYTGSTVDLTPPPSSQLRLDFVNATPLINVLGNSTWIGLNSYMLNATGVQLPITIAPNVTLTSSVDLASSGTFPNYYPFLVNGGGTLYLTGGGTALADVTVSQARLRVDSFTPLQSTSLTLDGGTLQYSGPTQSTDYPFAIGPGGGTVEVSNAGTTLTLTDAIGSATGVLSGPFTKAGPGVLDLTYTGNQFLGGVIVSAGRLEISDDAQLGLANVTVNQFGTLRYLASTTTARTFTLNAGTLDVSSGATLTLNGAAIGGGFVHGPGTIAVTGGTAFVGVTTSVNTVISQIGPGSYTNFTNGGAITIAAGVAGPITFSSFTNQGSAAITIGAASTASVADFQSYGTLTLNPGAVGSNQQTLLTNTGTSAMFFNGGSRTFIGTPQTANSGGQPTFVAGMDLEGKNLVIAGGLFVNNGFVSDFSSGTKGSIVVDFGALYKGAGFTGVSIVTQNGGRVQAGNSPGASTFASLTIGPGALNAFNWEINDGGPSTSFPSAPGVGGPQPNASNQVSGWSQEQAIIISQGPGQPPTTGNLTWTASSTAGNQFQLALFTLMNPSTVGQENFGPMADFDPLHRYMWPFLTYQGTYTGPTDSATLTADTLFDTSQFLNSGVFAGDFGLELVQNPGGGGSIDIVYPVPEPGSLALIGLAAIGWIRYWRRRWVGKGVAA